MLQLNTILQNRYRVLRLLGKGGMGAVYEALDQRVNCLVALKQTIVDTEEHLRAFQHEASLLANLRHAALPKVSDFFSEEGNYYLVMEHIPGDDLYTLLEKRKRPFSVRDVVRWGDELLRALEYLHGQEPPILHRDIKPPNLKLTKQNEIVLLDFGLAKGVAGQMPTMMASKSVAAYTLVYAPLEQIHGQGTDTRSDLYSTAATLYHLITGRTPSSAPKRFEDMDEDNPDPLIPANYLNREIGKELSDVLMKAMSMKRRDRYSSAKEMREAWQTANTDNNFDERRITGNLPPTEFIETVSEDEKQTLKEASKNKFPLPDTVIDSEDKTTNLSKTKAGLTEGVSTEAPSTEAAHTIKNIDVNVKAQPETLLVKDSPVKKTEDVKTSTGDNKKSGLLFGGLAVAGLLFVIVAIIAGVLIKNYLNNKPQGIITPQGKETVTLPLPTGTTLETFSTPGKVYEIQATPDGRMVASVGEDSIVRIWKVDEITIPIELKKHTKPVRTVALSRDGKMVASGGDDKEINLWETSNGKLIRTIQGHTNWVFRVAFSPDGKTLASASGDRSIKLWNTDDGKLIKSIQIPEADERFVDFSNDLKSIALYNAKTKGVRLWQMEENKMLRELQGNTNELRAAAFSPDNQSLALANQNGTVSVWNVNDGKLIRTLDARGEPSSLAFNNDGQAVAAGYGDGSILLWKTSDGSFVTQLRGHKNYVLSLSFSDKGNALFSGSEDKTIRLWEMK